MPPGKKGKFRRPWLLVVVVVAMVVVVALVASLGVRMLEKPRSSPLSQPPRRVLRRPAHGGTGKRSQNKAPSSDLKKALAAKGEAERMMAEARRMMEEAKQIRSAKDAPAAAAADPVPLPAYEAGGGGGGGLLASQEYEPDAAVSEGEDPEPVAAMVDLDPPVTAVRGEKGEVDPFAGSESLPDDGQHHGAGTPAAVAEVVAEAVAEEGVPVEPQDPPRRARSLDPRRVRRHAGAGAGDTGDASLPPCQEFNPCSDTCKHANNGVCDDGSDLMRARSDVNIHTLLCDLGTDCTDCGPLPEGVLPHTQPRTPESCGPVAHSASNGVEMFAAWTRTKPKFIMPFTDNKKDVDVSNHMYHGRVLEGKITHVWGKVTAECCARRGLVVDVGVNFGYFALYSAALGCDVVGWEPVPRFRSFLRYGIHANNLTDRVKVRVAAAGARGGGRVQITVPQAGIWGTAGVDGMNVDNAINDPGQFKLSVPIESVGEVVERDYPDREICLLKLDVEGYEPEAMEGMWNLFEDKRVAHFMMEYTPGVYERSGRWRDYWRPPAMLAKLNQYGYTVRSMGNKDSHPSNWDAPIPVLDVLGPETIRYDLLDAARAGFGRMGSIPWGLHPLSFHAQFGHNTDIWAARDDQPEYGRGPAPRIDHTTAMGLGGRNCRDLVHFRAPRAEIEGNLCHEDPNERKAVIQRVTAQRTQDGEKFLRQSTWAQELLRDELETWGVRPRGL